MAIPRKIEIFTFKDFFTQNPSFNLDFCLTNLFEEARNSSRSRSPSSVILDASPDESFTRTTRVLVLRRLPCKRKKKPSYSREQHLYSTSPPPSPPFIRLATGILLSPPPLMIVLSRLSNFGRLIPLPFRGETGILFLRRSFADPTSRIRIVVLSTMVENAASTVVTAWIKLRTSLLSPLTRPRIPRLTENETEFRRYTLFLFRTSWKNVKFYTERRKKEFNVFSVACLLFHCCENPRLKR